MTRLQSRRLAGRLGGPLAGALAGIGLLAAGCATAPVTAETQPDGARHLRCRLSLPECLVEAERLCRGRPYVVLRAVDEHDHRGGPELNLDVRTSEAVVRCGPWATAADPMAPPVAPAVAAPSPPPAAPAAAAPPPPARACVPGATQSCVGPGGCGGGQACLADGAAFGVCDCGVDATGVGKTR